jgi:ankyrin repeat protein
MKNKIELIDTELDEYYINNLRNNMTNKMMETIDETNENINTYYNQLINYVRLEKIDQIKNLIKTTDIYTYINYCNNDNYCLHTSVFIGNKQICEILLKNGADINIKDKYGHYPIHKIILCKNINILDLLMKYGGNIDQEDDNNNTILHMAIINKNIKLIKKILKYNPNLNIKNNLLLTPIECIDDEHILNLFN